MSATLTSLAEVRLRPVPDVIAMLEDILQRAQSGEIRGVVVAAGTDGRSTSTCFMLGESDTATLFLAIERVKLRLLQAGDE